GDHLRFLAAAARARQLLHRAVHHDPLEQGVQFGWLRLAWKRASTGLVSAPCPPPPIGIRRNKESSISSQSWEPTTNFWRVTQSSPTPLHFASTTRCHSRSAPTPSSWSPSAASRACAPA